MGDSEKEVARHRKTNLAILESRWLTKGAYLTFDELSNYRNVTLTFGIATQRIFLLETLRIFLTTYGYRFRFSLY